MLGNAHASPPFPDDTATSDSSSRDDDVIEGVTIPPSAPLATTASAHAPEASTINDLERLRDILYGGQSRTVEKRLGTIENELLALRRDAESELQERTLAVEQRASTALATARRDLEVSSEQSNEEQRQALRELQRLIDERFATLSTDFTTQLRTLQREMSERLEQQAAQHNEQLHALQVEHRQRNDALRRDVESLATATEGNKVSRQTLGQMLLELGLRLRDSDR